MERVSFSNLCIANAIFLAIIWTFIAFGVIAVRVEHNSFMARFISEEIDIDDVENDYAEMKTFVKTIARAGGSGGAGGGRAPPNFGQKRGKSLT